MNVVYANLKRTENPNVILFRHPIDTELDSLFDFVKPEASRLIKFDCDETSLAEDECYYVQLTDEQLNELGQAYVLNNNSTAELNTNGYNRQYQDIHTIYRVDEHGISFKRITKNNLISSNVISCLDDGPKFEKPTNKIALDEKVDLYLDTREKKLYFRNYKTAASITSILSEYYIEATQEETNEILESDIFDIAELDTHNIGQRNRKKIAYATKELNIDLSDANTIQKIKSYAHVFGMDDIFQNGKLKITNNSDLTKALDVITGRIFKNGITDDPMKATSMKKL